MSACVCVVCVCVQGCLLFVCVCVPFHIHSLHKHLFLFSGIFGTSLLSCGTSEQAVYESALTGRVNMWMSDAELSFPGRFFARKEAKVHFVCSQSLSPKICLYVPR